MNAKPVSIFAPWTLAIQSHQLLLVATNGREGEKVTELIAELALRNPIYIVAGSDWLPGDRLARCIRRRTVGVQPVLERARLVRAFTCYQLVDLLAEVPADGDPVLVLDFLHTLYSPDIPLPVRFRVLKECCQHLERLAQHKPVAVIVQKMSVADYQYFYPFLAAISKKILLHETVSQDASQLNLF